MEVLEEKVGHIWAMARRAEKIRHQILDWVFVHMSLLIMGFSPHLRNEDWAVYSTNVSVP